MLVSLTRVRKAGLSGAISIVSLTSVSPCAEKNFESTRSSLESWDKGWSVQSDAERA
jgi:hypothetical protein